MTVILQTAVLLTLSNIFMTFAWYAHLKVLRGKPLIIAVFASWGLAFFEYMLQVPANRLGFTLLELPKLKVMQEAITLVIFMGFAAVWLGEGVQVKYLISFALIFAAALVAFR